MNFPSVLFLYIKMSWLRDSEAVFIPDSLYILDLSLKVLAWTQLWVLGLYEI